VNNTTNFKDIFDNFLDYVFFQDYLNVCFFQTLQMKAIQSLNVPRHVGEEENENSAIVIEHTNTFLPQELIESVQRDDAPSQPVIVKEDGYLVYLYLSFYSMHLPGTGFYLRM
jgi:hypothetical protein